MHPMLDGWPCDEIAQRFPGMTTILYRKLSAFKGASINDRWKWLTDDEKIWLNDLADCYYEPN